MKRTLIISGIILAVVLIFIVWPIGSFISSYNEIIKLDQDAKKAWSQVENVYQRRLDLLPNLVNTVKGAANFEKETLTQVIEARASATKVSIDPTKMTEENFRQFEQAQGRLSSAISRLMVSVEAYPQLRATQAFEDLQKQIEGSENRISVERGNFNKATQEYNAYILKMVMPSLVASFKGFKEKPYFTADKEAAKAPTVKF
jgi:LemA protein